MVLLIFLNRLDNKNRRRIIFATYLTACLLCLAALPVPVSASQYHSLDDIRASLKTFVTQQFTSEYKVSTIIGKIDPYLRLASCDQALKVFFPPMARHMGATTLGVQCRSGEGWKIYLPVQIKVVGPAVVSKQSLPRGTILNKSDLAMANRVISNAMNGYFRSFEELEGMVLRSSMAQGQIIGPRSLKPRHMVKRGDIVTVIAETEGLQIQIKGKALMDGYEGQSIRIKNTRSKRVLQGEVIAIRTVRVRL